jgi:integrase
MGLRNLEKAQAIIREWEADGHEPEDPDPPTTLQEACLDFIEDARARNLTAATVSKYEIMFRRLKEFAIDRSLIYLTDFDVRSLRRFRATWTDSPISSKKKFERLRAFFRFCHEAGWIDQNPSLRLKNVKANPPPTMPFDRAQMVSIIGACDDYPDGYGQTGQANARRLRALVLLLRHSGLRISDAVTLACDRIDKDGRLFLFTAKTGVPVHLPLPGFVVDALAEVEGTNQEYFFWSGVSKTKSAVGDWQRSLRKLFCLANIPDGHAHRFRDTFATELLLVGVPLERVSILLGHQSVQVTERHYAPWVKARQEQLEADVQRSWAEDPLYLAETKGTREVRGGKEVSNSLKIQ